MNAEEEEETKLGHRAERDAAPGTFAVQAHAKEPSARKAVQSNARSTGIRLWII